MVRLRRILVTIGIIAALGQTGFAQDAQISPDAAPAAKPAAKSPARKAAHKTGNAVQAPVRGSVEDAEKAEKAARLEEGRRKFFEQSSGFENKNSDMPLSLGGSNGMTPAMGFKF